MTIPDLKRLPWLLPLTAAVLLVVIVLLVARPARRPISAARVKGARGTIYDRQGKALAFNARQPDSAFRNPQSAFPRDSALRTPHSAFLHDSAIRNPQSAIRVYPARETLSRLLGFPPDAGLEQSLDSILGPRQRTLGRVIPGRDVRLTIDLEVQRAVYRLLKPAVEATRSRQGSAVVLDPRTGAVLALADYPGYDPQKPRLYPPEVWQSPAVTRAFEPGNAAQIAVLLAEPSDPNRLRTALEQLGFARPSLVEVPGEPETELPDAMQLTLDSARFSAALAGQGYSTTLLRIARAWGVIANDGRLVEPLLVQHGRPPARPNPVLAEAAARTIRERLQVNPDTPGEELPWCGTGFQTPATLGYAGFTLPAGYVVTIALDQPLPGYASPAVPAELFQTLARQLPKPATR